MNNETAVALATPLTDLEVLNASFSEILGIEGDPKEIVAKFTAEKLPTLIIKDSSDTEGFKRVKEAYKLAVSTRTTLDKQKTELNKPHLENQRKNNEAAKELIALVAPIETTLKERIDAHENALRLAEEAKEKARLEAIERRVQRLFDAGGVFSGTLYICGNAYLTREQIELTDDTFFENAVLLFASEKQRIDAEQKQIKDKAESDALELENLRKQLAALQPLPEPAALPEKKVLEKETIAPPTNNNLEPKEADIILISDSISVEVNDNSIKALNQIIMLCKLSSGDAAQLKNTIIKIQGLAEKALAA
jgi:hypothetical protein